jgi:hypothetical protein
VSIKIRDNAEIDRVNIIVEIIRERNRVPIYTLIGNVIIIENPTIITDFIFVIFTIDIPIFSLNWIAYRILRNIKANVVAIAAPTIPYIGIKIIFKKTLSKEDIVLSYISNLENPIEVSAFPIGPKKIWKYIPRTSTLNVSGELYSGPKSNEIT